MSRSGRPWILVLLACSGATLSVSGCGVFRPGSQPEIPAQYVAEDGYHLGTPVLAHPPQVPPSFARGDLWFVDLTLRAATARPEGFDSIAERFRIVRDPNHEAQLVVQPQFAAGIRGLEPESDETAPGGATLHECRRVLAEGTTAWCRVQRKPPGGSAGRVSEIGVSVYRREAGGALGLALRLGGWLLEESADDDPGDDDPGDEDSGDEDSGDEERPGQTHWGEELVVLDLLELDRRFFLWIPEDSTEGQAGVTVEVFVSSRGAALTDAEIEACQSTLAPVTRAAPAPVGMELDIAALKWNSTRRRALLHLALGTGAHLARDFALSASDASLSDYCERLRAQWRTPADNAAAGWLVESTLYSFLAEAMEDGVPVELESLLCQHAGESGRHASSIQEAVHAATTVAELEASFVEDNTLFLLDTSPRARVRAFDWLTARGLAPAGYSPDGSPQERRRALQRALSSETAVSENPVESQ